MARAKEPSPAALRRALEKDVGAAFEALYATMREVRGDATREQAAWSALVDRIALLRRAAGHEDPTLLLAEIIALEGWGKNDPTFDVLDPDDAESRRWMAQIDAAVQRAAKPKKAAGKPKKAAAKPKRRDG